MVGDGKEAFIEYFEKMGTEYPKKTIQFVRVIAEGDLVALHTHQVWPGVNVIAGLIFWVLNSKQEKQMSKE